MSRISSKLPLQNFRISAVSFYKRASNYVQKFKLADVKRYNWGALIDAARHNNKIIITKISGKVLDNERASEGVAADVIYSKIYQGSIPIYIHGGGKPIDDESKRRGIEIKKHKSGNRETDEATLGVVKDVLIGEINPGIVNQFHNMGYRQVVGAADLGDNLILVKKDYPGGDDVGFVGKPIGFNEEAFSKLVDYLRKDYIPVIPSVGRDKNGQLYNINADVLAEFFAKELKKRKIKGIKKANKKIHKLVYVSDIDGIKDKPDGSGNLISIITRDIFEKGKGKIFTKGIIPKIESILNSLKYCKSISIVNGLTRGSLALELATRKGKGTMFKQMSLLSRIKSSASKPIERAL